MTVRGQRVRWVVTPPDAGRFVRVLVQADGGGQRLVSSQEVHSASGLAVHPGQVAALINHALDEGWKPDLPGPDRPFTLPQARHLGPVAPPLAGTVLVHRLDLDPLRVSYPWPHLREVFIDFALTDPLSETSIGTVVAHLARWSKIPPAADTLQRLAESEEPADTWGTLPGGIELWQDGRLLAAHGCCADLSDWTQWRALSKPTWNGHDPCSGASMVEGEVHLLADWGQVCLCLGLEVYQAMVDALEARLRGFFDAMEAWLLRRCSPQVATRIVDRLRARHGL